MLTRTSLLSFFILSVLSLVQVSAQTNNQDNARINILAEASLSELQQMVLVDARSLKSCQSLSVKGAKCLPANTFYSPKGQLASFGDIRWALGTANLKESDNILVFAEKPQDRYFLAGLLFLAGQQKVSYWSGTISELQDLLGKASGQSRGILRTHIYSGIMRDHFAVLANEVKALKESGWQLSTTTKIKLNKIKKLIIMGRSPIKNLSTFAKLHAEGNHQLLVSITKP